MWSVEPPSIGDLAERYDLDLEKLIRERRQGELEELIKPLRTPQTSIDTRVLCGTPFLEVIRAVIHNRYDLVIKAARSPVALSERLLGSTDIHLLRKCPCPVWIDRPGETFPYRCILAAVDPLAEEGAGTERLVMDLATSLAAREKAQLAVVHAWQLRQEDMLRSFRSHLPSSEIDRLVVVERERHEQALQRLLARYALPEDCVYLMKGVAAEVIQKQVQTLQADLIVMGTLGRTAKFPFHFGSPMRCRHLPLSVPTCIPRRWLNWGSTCCCASTQPSIICQSGSCCCWWLPVPPPRCGPRF